MTKTEKQAEFDRLLGELGRDFISAESKGESREQLGAAAVNYILQQERLRRGVEQGSSESLEVDLQTLAGLRQWDTDDPTMAVLEKFFKRLAGGRLEDAVTLIDRAVQARRQEISVRQRSNATTPRATHPIDLVIRQIVDCEPHVTQGLLLRRIRAQAGRGVVESVDDGVIYFNTQQINSKRDGHPVLKAVRSIMISGLKDRLSRIKNSPSR